MKVAIMQPYLFPYIGYFQLINSVDKFVIYDNIKYTKKGWINRNRILFNGKSEYFTIPLKKDSDYLNIEERKISQTFENDKISLLRKIIEAYKKAPEFNLIYPLIENLFNCKEENLFYFLFQSLKEICNLLEINTEFIVSSSISIDHKLKSEEKVIAICNELKASEYINPIGGIELYSKEKFMKNNIKLCFIQSDFIKYNQFNNEFQPWLSIIDLLMFNSKDEIKKNLNCFKLI